LSPGADAAASAHTHKFDGISPQALEDKASAVHAMFEALAARYDLVNDVLSLGIHRAWRKEATHEACADGAARILDVATGTADVAIELKQVCPHAEVIGVDFSEAMLTVGRHKIANQGLDIRLEQGDGLNLPYADNSFDVITVAYGFRNFANYPQGLAEFARVLKPAGKLVMLDFPPPPEGLLGRAFRMYCLQIAPLLGGLITGNLGAYSYLGKSALAFPKPADLAHMMLEAGFTNVRYRLQSFGVSAIHVATLPT
jgi:demethylmenaquinone methyltransferase/2-methoxy-6-polyprenyl-1,4-benzoquinol methylase